MALPAIKKDNKKFLTPRDGVFVARILKAFDWMDLDLKNPKTRAFMEEEKFTWIPEAIQKGGAELKTLVTIFFDVEGDIYKKTLRGSEWVNDAGESKSTLFKINRIFEDSGAMDQIAIGQDYQPDFKDLVGKMVKIRIYRLGKYMEVYDAIARHETPSAVLEDRFQKDSYTQNYIAKRAEEAGIPQMPVPTGTPGNGADLPTPADDDEPLPF